MNALSRQQGGRGPSARRQRRQSARPEMPCIRRAPHEHDTRRERRTRRAQRTAEAALPLCWGVGASGLGLSQRSRLRSAKVLYPHKQVDKHIRYGHEGDTTALDGHLYTCIGYMYISPLFLALIILLIALGSLRMVLSSTQYMYVYTHRAAAFSLAPTVRTQYLTSREKSFLKFVEWQLQCGKTVCLRASPQSRESSRALMFSQSSQLLFKSAGGGASGLWPFGYWLRARWGGQGVGAWHRATRSGDVRRLPL